MNLSRGQYKRLCHLLPHHRGELHDQGELSAREAGRRTGGGGGGAGQLGRADWRRCMSRMHVPVAYLGVQCPGHHGRRYKLCEEDRVG